jgi:hypothetical protein
MENVRNCVEDRSAIEAFIATEKKRHRPVIDISVKVRETAERLKGVLETFKTACSLPESDAFGSISHVNLLFYFRPSNWFKSA